MDGISGRPFSMVAVALGCLFAAVAGHIFVRLVVDPLRRTASPADPRPAGIGSSVQGVVERILYTTSWYLGHPGLIPVWLAIKTGGQWKRFGEGPGFTVFLVGSGLSLLYGAAGGRLIHWLLLHRWSSAIFYPVVLMLGCVILRLWVALGEKGGRD